MLPVFTSSPRACRGRNRPSGDEQQAGFAVAPGLRAQDGVGQGPQVPEVERAAPPAHCAHEVLVAAEIIEAYNTANRPEEPVDRASV
ncbi:hypothetical protein ABIA39_007836 [Nocardia sp. GAS34]